MDETQNLTIRLSVATVKKVRIAAAKRGISISSLVTEKIEEIAGEDAAYEPAKRRALRLLNRGFTLAAGRFSGTACTNDEPVRLSRFSFACINAEPPSRRDCEGFAGSVSASLRHD